VGNICSHYGEDMHMSLDDFKREVTRWRHLWRMSKDGNLQTLVETLDYTNVELYPGDASDISCVNLRRRSGTKRLQMALRSTVSDERLPSLVVLHVHQHEEVISEFAGKKDRRLSLCL